MLWFPSHIGLPGFKRERYGSKAWIFLRDLKHRVGVVVTCQWELSEQGGDILRAPGPSVSMRLKQVGVCTPVCGRPACQGRELVALAWEHAGLFVNIFYNIDANSEDS